jgi:inorganic pyrophosphatase
MNNKIQMIVEIPKGSSNKYEYDITDGSIALDRVLYGANFYPGEYGFVPETLDWDGDPLDVISLATYLAVFADDPRFTAFQTINDVPQHLKDEIQNFFLQYKALQKKEVKINGWGTLEEALEEIQECKERYTEYETRLLKGEKDAILAEWKAKGLGQASKVLKMSDRMAVASAI